MLLLFPCSAPMLAASSGAPAQESGADDSASLPGDALGGLCLLQGCGASCWGSGWWLAESGSIFLRR